jgi:DNA-binding MarR family transcriptional regulator
VEATAAAQGSKALARLVGFQLHLANMHTMAAARTALADVNTTPAKVTAMLFVLDHPGCDQTTLGKFMSVGRSGIMKLLNTIEARGHLERRNGRDLRSNGLYLSMEGEKFLQQVLELLKESDRAVSSTLSPTEQDELLRLLHKMQGASGAGSSA